MDRLIKRSAAILGGQFGPRIASHKDFKEWKIYDLPKHIEQLAAAALAEGFPEWV